jgi:hypothetical protein
MDLAIKANTSFHPYLKSQEQEINKQAELYIYTYTHTHTHKYTTHGGWDSVVSINNSLQAEWYGLEALVDARFSTYPDQP